MSSARLNISSILCSAFDLLIAGHTLSLHNLVDSHFHFTPICFSVHAIQYFNAVSDLNIGASHFNADIFFAFVASDNLLAFIFFIASLFANVFASDAIIRSASCAFGFIAVLYSTSHHFFIHFDNAVHTIGIAPPIAPHIAHHFAISHIVDSSHLSNIGCVAQNQAPTTPERRARLHAHFAHAKYHPHIGDTASATSGKALPTLNALESNSGDSVTSLIFFTSSQNHAFQKVAKSKILPPYCNTFSVAPAPSMRALYAHFCSGVHFWYFSSNCCVALSLYCDWYCFSIHAAVIASTQSSFIFLSASCSSGVSQSDNHTVCFIACLLCVMTLKASSLLIQSFIILS